jgi:hypothetical protein
VYPKVLFINYFAIDAGSNYVDMTSTEKHQLQKLWKIRKGVHDIFYYLSCVFLIVTMIDWLNLSIQQNSPMFILVARISICIFNTNIIHRAIKRLRLMHATTITRHILALPQTIANAFFALPLIYYY